jgi:hypothetical protein
VNEVRAHSRQQHNEAYTVFTYSPNFAADDAFGTNVQRAFPAVSPEALELTTAAMAFQQHANAPPKQNDLHNLQALMIHAMQQQVNIAAKYSLITSIYCSQIEMVVQIAVMEHQHAVNKHHQ